MRHYFLLVATLCYFFSANSQNVGIGTTTPNGRLQFANEVWARQIVLKETNNNGHNYAGLGMGSHFDMVYQVPDQIHNHIFQAGDGVFATGSNLLFQITGTGHVGIGIRPTSPLQFANVNANRKIVLRQGAENDHNFYGFGINDFVLRYQVLGTDASHVFFAAAGPAASNELLRIKGDGNVGIGQPNPVARLHFKNEINSRILILNESIRNNHNFFGFGINEFTLRYQVADPLQSHVFFAGNAANATASNELFRIHGNGNVGIAQSNPQVPLHFASVLGKKISLYRGPFGDAGLGVFGNELRMHSDYSGADITFGYDDFTNGFIERFRMRGNGVLAIGGNAGQPGEVLSSNGTNLPPSWRAIGQQFPTFVGSPGTWRVAELFTPSVINASTVNVPSRGNVKGLLWIRLTAKVVGCLVGSCPGLVICEVQQNGTEIYRTEKLFTLYADVLLSRDECWLGPFPITTVAGNNAFTFRVSGRRSTHDIALTGHVMLMGE